MIREVHPNLFVGDGEAVRSDLKRLAGYAPGATEMVCTDCSRHYLADVMPPLDDNPPPRCLDCALKHIAENWFIIHAAKEPWHRDALGYTERGAPPNHPEYLVAKRPGELMLNLVDMKSISPQYTNPIVEAAFEAIDDNLSADLEHGKKILIHCNEGKSRAPTIALLWLGRELDEFQSLSFDAAAAQFTQALYPEYDPGIGMANYARQRWGHVEEQGNGD